MGLPDLRAQIKSTEIPIARFGRLFAGGFCPPCAPARLCFRAATPLRIVEVTAAATVFCAVKYGAANFKAKGRQTRMRPKFRSFSRYRPRLLTVVVLAIVAAMLVLANLTYDIGSANMASAYVEYGWPLIWRRYDVGLTGNSALDRLSAARLTANLSMWLVMLAAPGIACEWLLRRYQPQFRWSLRALLLAIGVIGGMCAWIATVRDRAEVQDALIAKMTARDGENAWVEHWGPKWLGFFGVDRFRRRIVGANVHAGYYDDDQQKNQDDLETVDRLLRSPRLQSLNLHMLRCTPAMSDRLSRMRSPNLQLLHISMDRLTPAIATGLRQLPRLQSLSLELYEIDPRAAEALGEIQHLRMLRVDNQGFGDSDQMSRNCLAAAGKLTQLEHLRLRQMTINPESLKSLAEAVKLKSLGLDCVSVNEAPLLSHLPPLPQLEALDLEGSDVGDEDLACLKGLPRLKSINLTRTDVTGAGLTQLACIESLEELAVDDAAVTVAAIESLTSLKRLKTLHINVFGRRPERQFLGGDLDSQRRKGAFDGLRQSNPGIIIDDQTHATASSENCWEFPHEYELAR